MKKEEGMYVCKTLLSVIIPVYNSESVISDCVASLNPTVNKNWEIILVNDGSSDSSLEICKKIASQNENVIVINKENGGVSSARNEGMKYARGYWVMFIDSDDYLEKGTDEVITSYANVSQKGELELIHFGTTRTYFKDGVNVKNKKTEMSVFSHDFKNSVCLEMGNDFETLFDCDFFDRVTGKLYKNDIIKKNKIQFNEKMQCREDSVFILNYCQFIHNAILLNNYGYIYRIENDETYQFRRKIEIWEIEELYQAYEMVLCRNKQLYRNSEEKICVFMFHVFLYGIIHNAVKRYDGSFVKTKNYIQEGIHNACVYSCIMKSSSRSNFLKLIIKLLQRKKLVLVSLLCYFRFANL